MKRILLFLLTLTTAASAQTRLDSARTTGAVSVTPQWWQYGSSASTNIIGFRLPNINKEFSIYSAFQSDLRFLRKTGNFDETIDGIKTFRPTLNQTANNQTLRALIINPIFNSNGFTGGNNISLDVTGNAAFSGSTTATTTTTGTLLGFTNQPVLIGNNGAYGRLNTNLNYTNGELMLGTSTPNGSRILVGGTTYAGSGRGNAFGFNGILSPSASNDTLAVFSDNGTIETGSGGITGYTYTTSGTAQMTQGNPVNFSGGTGEGFRLQITTTAGSPTINISSNTYVNRAGRNYTVGDVLTGTSSGISITLTVTSVGLTGVVPATLLANHDVYLKKTNTATGGASPLYVEADGKVVKGTVAPTPTLQTITDAGNTTTNTIVAAPDTIYSGYPISSRSIPIQGDSNDGDNYGGNPGTSSFPTPPGKAWPTLLVEDLNVSQNNFSVPARKLASTNVTPVPGANTLWDNIGSLTQYVNSIATPVFLIKLGTNDANASLDTVRFRTQYLQILDSLIIRKNWPSNRIIIASAMYRGEGNTSSTPLIWIENIVREVASSKNVRYLNLYNITKTAYIAGNGNIYNSDNLHLSPDIGQPLVKNAFLQALEAANLNFYDTGRERLTIQGTANINDLKVNRTLEVGTDSYLKNIYQRGFQEVQVPSGYTISTLGGNELTDATVSLGSNWSGTLASGYTHTSGSTAPITSSFVPTVGVTYKVVLTASGRTAGQVTVSMGGSRVSTLVNNSNSMQAMALTATSTAGLVITPTSTFNGTIVLSVVKIVAGTPFYNSRSGVSTNNLQIRYGANGNLFGGASSGQFTNVTTGNTASLNTSWGTNSFEFLTEAVQSSALGARALRNLNSGSGNTATGFSSSLNLRDASGVSSYGQNSLLNNLSSNNTAFGASSGLANTTGSNNVYLGHSTTGITTGSNNLVVGANYTAPDTASANTIYITDGAGNLTIQVKSTTDRVQRRFLATPTGSTGAFTSRAIDNLDLPVVDVAHGGTGTTTGLTNYVTTNTTQTIASTKTFTMPTVITDVSNSTALKVTGNGTALDVDGYAKFTGAGMLDISKNVSIPSPYNLNLLSVTANRVLQTSSINTVEASAVTNTELGYLSGATSNIQTQLNNKGTFLRVTGSGTGAATTISIPHGLSGVTSASIVLVQPINAASAGVSYVTSDATNINIVYTVAPASGTNNLSYNVSIKP